MHGILACIFYTSVNIFNEWSLNVINYYELLEVKVKTKKCELALNQTLSQTDK